MYCCLRLFVSRKTSENDENTRDSKQTDIRKDDEQEEKNCAYYNILLLADEYGLAFRLNENKSESKNKISVNNPIE